MKKQIIITLEESINDFEIEEMISAWESEPWCVKAELSKQSCVQCDICKPQPIDGHSGIMTWQVPLDGGEIAKCYRKVPESDKDEQDAFANSDERALCPDSCKHEFYHPFAYSNLVICKKCGKNDYQGGTRC